jgi:CDP-diacylglycerol---glycerol-3-phosphate 3-phosphatidyltransferase
MYNLANQLTLMRIALIPLLVIAFYLPFSWKYPLCCGLFILAGITDWADGFIARRYQLTTPFGAFLDPVADKLMVAVALALLIQAHNSAAFTLPAAVIICREIGVSALREWMAEAGSRAAVAVSMLGKVKTTFQMTAIGILLAFDSSTNLPMLYFGYATLYAAAILTLWSMVGYLRAAWPSFRK